MTKEELREHCEKQVKACEMWAENRGQEPSGKVYEEHKLILDLINELQDKSYELWKESYEVEHARNIQLEEKIKLLEQQPSEDCVSRQAVDQLCYRFLSHSAHEIAFYEHFCDLPTVTPTRKVGKWIRKPIRNDKGGCIGAEMICSCCNKDNRHDEYMDYCPNCGAEMMEAKNGNN